MCLFSGPVGFGPWTQIKQAQTSQPDVSDAPKPTLLTLHMGGLPFAYDHLT